MSAAGSTQAVAGREGGRGEREGEREGGLRYKHRLPCAGPRLLQSESPYRMKAGSFQQCSRLVHEHVRTFTRSHARTRRSRAALEVALV